ncbi:MAG TPA: EFR1 family ferrodoxin [Spirochaetota bacterium]|nr:EFR1 family ferrodoxin [Spirochaetota bacterium]
MKKAIIAYFSQSGTTAKVAEKISRGLEDKKISVDIHCIQEKKQIEIDSYDLIGIGFPVYIFRVPFLVKKFLKDLPDLKGKPFFVFMLYGTIRGTAGNNARRILEKKGGREVGYSHYTGDDIYIGYLKKGYLFSPGHPVKKEINRAYRFGGEIADILNGKAYSKPPYESLPGIVFSIERMLTIKPLINYLYRPFFRVDRVKCNKCGICVKNCPTGNIRLGNNGYPLFGKNCICCWYCEMKCPAEAITTPLDWPILNLFNSYNIRKTLKDPAVEYAAVRLSKGKVERIPGG